MNYLYLATQIINQRGNNSDMYFIKYESSIFILTVTQLSLMFIEKSIV